MRRYVSPRGTLSLSMQLDGRIGKSPAIRSPLQAGGAVPPSRWSLRSSEARPAPPYRPQTSTSSSNFFDLRSTAAAATSPNADRQLGRSVVLDDQAAQFLGGAHGRCGHPVDPRLVD